jgi:hypothetical protein
MGENQDPASIPSMQRLVGPSPDIAHHSMTSKRKFGTLSLQLLPGAELSHILRAYTTKVPLSTVVVEVMDPAFPTAHRPKSTLVLSDVVVSRVTQKQGTQICFPALDAASKDGAKMSLHVLKYGKPTLMRLTEIECTFRTMHCLTG